MSCKQSVKYGLGFIRCKLNHIPLKSGTKVYIGKDVNVVGGHHVRLGHNVCIRPGVDLWCCGQKIEIGTGTEIGERSRISIAHTLIIGEKVLLSPNIYITDCDHAFEDIEIPVLDQGVVRKANSIVIKEHSYIGINTVIVGNVVIGKHCVIGANSVVTRSMPDYCVAVGSPAKVIKRYNFQLKKWEKI